MRHKEHTIIKTGLKQRFGPVLSFIRSGIFPVFISLCAALRCDGNSLETLGIRGDHGTAFSNVMASTSHITLDHPATAAAWADRFICQYGYKPGNRGNEDTITASSGRYNDPRNVEFTFFPAALAAQRGGCHIGQPRIDGLSIDSLDYDSDRQLVTATTLVFSSGQTFAGLTIRFPCAAEEWPEILRACNALRLRLRLETRILRVSGKEDYGAMQLLLILDPIQLELLDTVNVLQKIDRNIAVTPHTYMSCRDRPEHTFSIRQGQIFPGTRAPDDSTALNNALAGNGTDPVAPLRLLLNAENISGLPYSEGLQPFRKGWYLKDSFPGMHSRMIVICNHTSLPASLTIKLAAPLPPGIYKIGMRSTYYRARLFDNILHVSLGDDQVETAYWGGGGQHSTDSTTWIAAPALRITEPSDKIVVTAIQIGSGGQAQTPQYFRRWIAFDRIFITNLLSGPEKDCQNKAKQ